MSCKHGNYEGINGRDCDLCDAEDAIWKICAAKDVEIADLKAAYESLFKENAARRSAILASPAPSVGEPDTTMWAVRITGPDDLYAAPDRQVAGAVALVLNRQFARHQFPDEVRVTAEVVAWPHGYESWSAQKDLLQLEVRGIES